ncbi:hypothetical protein SAMN05216464_13217, partial [Mucilaginibacter pineti]
ISLNVTELTAEQLSMAVQTVLEDPGYLTAIRNINDSFRSAGGYPKAVEEIFAFKNSFIS